jgi:ribose transport system substrate-binding protein
MSHSSNSGEARRRPASLLATLALLLVAVFAFSACGDDEKSTAADSTPKAEVAAEDPSDAGQKEIFALADELVNRPTEIPVKEPVGKEIPSGKQTIWINCGAPVCTLLGKSFAEGAKELGWTTKILNTDGTPASVQKAWKQAVVAKPDAVASSGTDPAAVSAQLKALKGADIPVVNYAVPEETDGITLLTADADNIATTFAEPSAAWVSKDSNGKANTLYTTVPAFTILPPQTALFKEVYEKGCPGCPLEVLELPVTALGKDAAQRIVSKIRSNPKITYVVNALDDVTIGLPAALKAAGLADKVKLIGGSSTALNFQYIATDQQDAAVPNDIPGLTWQMVDGLARIFAGVETEVDKVPQARYIITKENVPEGGGIFPFVADYKAQYRKLWGKG